MKDMRSECVAEQAELVKHTKPHNLNWISFIESREVSSVRACLQLFGTAHLFTNTEYCAE